MKANLTNTWVQVIFMTQNSSVEPPLSDSTSTKVMQTVDDARRKPSEPPLPFNERRRLSECVEEEEGENGEVVPSEAKEKTNPRHDDNKPVRVGKFMVTRAHLSDNRKLHVDKYFFDDSLVEIRVQPDVVNACNKIETVQTPPVDTDRVWIKRADLSAPSLTKVVSITFLSKTKVCKIVNALDVINNLNHGQSFNRF